METTNIQALEAKIMLKVEQTIQQKLQKLSLKFYSPDELAQMLSVDARMIRKLCKAGEIQSIRVGTSIRVEQKELLRWLETFK